MQQASKTAMACERPIGIFYESDIMKHIRMTGLVKSGVGWATKHNNWPRMVLAHQDELPDIADFVQGTLNVTLTDPTQWIPPDDDYHRTASRSKGIRLKRDPKMGGDFLFFGNYIHPTIRVIEINGIAIDGLVYYAGSDKGFTGAGDPLPVGRLRVEIISKTKLRELLGMQDTIAAHPVELVISVQD
jgi:hypothetical protein